MGLNQKPCIFYNRERRIIRTASEIREIDPWVEGTSGRNASWWDTWPLCFISMQGMCILLMYFVARFVVTLEVV